MKVLVTGGAGYIGSHAAHQLSDAGHDVTVLDNLCNGYRWAVPKSAKFIHGDISDRPLVSEVLKRQGIEAILHFAAHIEVPESILNPLKYYRNNTLGSLELFQAAVDAGVAKIIYSSTAAVYGDVVDPVLVSEVSKTRPINPYGQSKLMGERVLDDLSRASSLHYVALRYFNVAGARLDGRIGQSTPNATHLIKIASQAALGRREKILVYGTDYPTPDGTGVRDYIHVEDLIHAHVLALDYLVQGGSSTVMNCGYGHGYSVLEVIEAMKRVSGSEIKVEAAPRRPGDSAQLVADSGKIKRILGWKPQFDDLELICRAALEWERKSADSRE